MEFAKTLIRCSHFICPHHCSTTPPINCFQTSFLHCCLSRPPPPSYPFSLFMVSCWCHLLSASTMNCCFWFENCYNVTRVSCLIIRLLFVNWRCSAIHRCCVSTVFLLCCYLRISCYMHSLIIFLSFFLSSGNKWLRCGARICSSFSILLYRCSVLLSRLEGFVHSFNCVACGRLREIF